MGVQPHASSLQLPLPVRYLQPFSFACTTHQTLHPTLILARLWLTRLRTAELYVLAINSQKN